MLTVLFSAMSPALVVAKPSTPNPSKVPGAPLPPLPLSPGLPKRTLFGVGVGFEKSGTTQGAVVSTVLPKSPAARAGLAVGCIVTEINGQQTVGRAGDECAQIIKDCFGPVRMKFLDPTLKEKTLSLDKVWLTLP